MAKALTKLGIPVTVILDAAVGYIMEKVDLAIVGAEGVVENGGIINKIGTNQMAVCAKAQNKPFYVVAESFKFVRLFPLNQQDVPNKFKYKADTLKKSEDLTAEHPFVDYTPPSLITLLFTDLGVLTPSAVSDELIKLYL
ncbi:UNVERIFIED_CONTAM: Translation initiation factor [Gekko kuhli]